MRLGSVAGKSYQEDRIHSTQRRIAALLRLRGRALCRAEPRRPPRSSRARSIEQKDGSAMQMSERMIAMSTTPNLASVKPSLDKLQTIERELTASPIERDEVIRASLVALLARQGGRRNCNRSPPSAGASRASRFSSRRLASSIRPTRSH
jgi:hypothetical protein